MDFQHRHLKHLFSTSTFWKRELGYQAQIRSGRQIMLSSNDSRKDCEHFYPRSKGRTSVVRFAVQPPVAIDYSEACAIAETYGLPEHFFYLPNQFWKHKNHRTVIEALHLLKQQGKDVVVAASGQPVDSRHPEHFLELQDLVGSYGLTENFRFVGMVPRDHVFALMRASTALINPSLFEGWSTTVEEAKSLGVPLLLSKLGVHVEQAEGFASFFDAEDPSQLASLLAAQVPLPLERRRQMADAAMAESKRRVRQYALDFSDTIERAVALFRER
jgi:glycosyltransferase involved in cell wall biosynthesis